MLVSSMLASGASATEHSAIERLEAEMQKGVHTINSNTMRVARKMCGMVAHKAYEEKALTNEEFLEASANCAKGNLHEVFAKLGGNLLDDAQVASIELEHNVVRHISKWEHEAMDLWHKVRPVKK
ncbi:MAG: hypothetical protein VW226_13565 [Rhodospirillaceae bacterium]